MNSSHPVEDKILRMLWSSKNHLPISARELEGIAKPAAARKALARLAKSGKLRRIRRGLYERPRFHPIIGQSPSSSMAVVEAVMNARHAPWQVSGAYAANLLGLSEQVPGQLIIKTTASVPPVNLGKTQIKFQRVAPSSLIGAGSPAGTVIQAVRHMGRGGMEPALKERLRQNLEPRTKRELIKLTPQLPQWMQPVVREITAVSAKT